MHLGNNRSVLQHEAFHRFMAGAYPGIRAWPRWFDEGLADWIARGRFVDERFTLPERWTPQKTAPSSSVVTWRSGSLVAC
jgi:hypothetical protein